MSNANLTLFAMGQGITKSVESMTQAEAAQLRYAYAMDTLSGVMGTFTNTAGSEFSSQTVILSASLKEAGVSIGNILIPPMIKATQFVNALVKSFTNMSSGGKIAVITFAGVAMAAGPLLSLTSKIITAVLATKTAFQLQGKALDENTIKTLKNTLAQHGQGVAFFQAGLMGLSKAAATDAMALADTVAIPPTYGLGAAMKFLSGPVGIVLGLLALAIPLFINLATTAEDAAGKIDDTAMAMSGIDTSLGDANFDLNISSGSSDIGMDTTSIDTAKDSFMDFLTETSEGLSQLLATARNSNGQITKSVQDEYKKQTAAAVAELEKRKVAEKNAAMAKAVESGKSLDEINAELAEIDNRYNKEIEITQNAATTLQDVWTNHVNEKGELTAEGWALYSQVTQEGIAFAAEQEASANQARMDANTQAYEDMYGKQMAITQAFIQNHKDMTVEGLTDAVENAKTMYGETVSAAEQAYNQRIALAEEDLAANRISNDEYTAIIEQEKELLHQRAADAELAKKAIINTALNELAERNGANQQLLDDAVGYNTKIEDEHKRHNDKEKELLDQKTEDIEAAHGDFEEIAAIEAQYNSDIAAENATHISNINELYSKQEEALKSLDQETMEAFSSILDTAQTEGVNIRDEVDAMANDMISSIDSLPTEFLGYGSDTIQGLIDGIKAKKTELMNAMSEIAGIVDGTYQRLEEIESPSKVMKRLGGYTIEGLIIGIDEKTKKLRESAQNIGSIVSDYSKQALNMMVAGGSHLLSGSMLNDNKATTNNYNNQRSITTSVNVQSGQDKLEIERMWRNLVRKQAVAIAR